ncbi:hypothetical protein DZC72_15645 [Maribacter algicola]|uniref:Peptidase S74 domain-containing protein n=2 Tax=Maribacter algicola TaxID=2498892 RepID=A0A426RFL2_9FLAO|nr:hypothetical protein DZC72_15645 [Maribacter algicola]
MATMAAFAQIKIGDNPQNIDPGSLLELESNSRVLVISKVSTEQMEAIAPQRGGIVYNTDTECIHYFDGAQWVNLCDAVSFTLTNDPIENLRSTIAITQTQGNYNLEVATNSIRTEQIADGGINGVDIQDNSIGRNKLGDAAVGPDELATESVDSDAIIDRTILPRDIASSVPNHVLATDINGVVLWQDQNDVYELSFDKDTNTLAIVPGTGLGSNSINLEALVGSDDQEIEVFSFDPVNNIITLTLEDGGTETVNLSNLSNSGTDEQDLGTATLLNEELTINIENGNPTTADLSDFATDVSLSTGLALKEDVSNKSNETTLGNSTTLYPTQNAVKVYVDTEIADIVTSGGSDPINEQNLTFEVAGGELRISDIAGTLAVPLTDIDTNTQLTDADITALGYIKTDLDEQNLAQVLTQGNNAGGNAIIGLDNSTDPTSAATRGYVDANLGGAQDLADVLGNGTSAGNNQINDLLDPTDPQDAATQNYVETRIATILGAGGADGVVTAITPTAIGFDVTGSNGGFNGSLDLDANFVTETELASINIVSTDTPNAITTGLDGGAVYNDTPITTALTANTAAIATINTSLLGKEDAANKSTDGTLSDNSDIEFPTEQAVKTYVDNQISTIQNGNNLGNSNLTQAAEDRTYDLNSQNLIFTGLGNVGIGNGANPPQNKFHVAGEIRVEGVNSADGTLANPAYTFSGDTNNDTGLYRPAADEIGFAVGGVEALRMEEDGGNTNVTIFQSLTLDNLLLDKDGDAGTPGQILSSTGTQTDWIDAPTGGTVNTDATLTGDGQTGTPLSIADNSINSARIADGTIANEDIAANAIETANILDANVTEAKIAPGADGEVLTTAGGVATWAAPTAGAVISDATLDGDGQTGTPLSIANNSITSARIVDGTIINADIAANAIETANILDSNVTEGKIAPGDDGEVLTTAGGVATWAAPTAGVVISDATLDGNGQTGTPLSIADNSITSARIVDGTIANADIAANAIETANILDANVTEAKIAPGADGDVLTTVGGVATWAAPTAGAVSTDGTTITGDGNATDLSVPIGGITTGQILDGTIANADIAANAIETANILDANVTEAKIAPGADGEVLTTAGGVATWAAPTAGAVISDATLDGDGQTGTPLSIANNSINSARIIDSSINADDLADDSVETAKILNGTIINEDIAPGAAIDGSKINPDFGGNIITTTSNIQTTGAGNFVAAGAGSFFKGAVDQHPDYVFEKYFKGFSIIDPSYNFITLNEIEEFLRKNHHLPGIKSAEEVRKDGIWDLGTSNLQNLEKIEELFLHTIEQEKKIETLQEENQALSKELEALKIQVEAIKKMLSKKE